MKARKHTWLLMVFLMIALCSSLLNVTSARADGETPGEPPAPTQVEAEPTEPAAESTPEPVAATETPIAEILPQLPEGTEVVVLDESGESVPLATEVAAEAAEIVDPMWCPEGVLPGGAGCSTNFGTISALLSSMRNTASSYDEAGVIYFTTNPGTQALTLTDAATSLGTSYDVIKNYNLTLQGGWDGASTSLSGQTNFGTRPMTIGTSTNPWAGNLTLNDFVFSSPSSTAVTIYTSSGDITLNNVDVNNQGNGANTALLNSASGDITVTNGSYDGNRVNSAGNSNGFSATAGGSITVSNSSFTDNLKSGSATSNGASLSAPVVTLANVTATNNDGSGVFFTGSSLLVNGGTFSGNQRYGIELTNTGSSFVIQSQPACSTNTLGCYNVTDTSAPTLSLPSDITTSATSSAGAVVTYSASATDNWDGSTSVSCSPPSGSTFAIGTTTVHCSSTDTAGNTAAGSFTVTVVDNTVVVTPVTPVPTSTSQPSQNTEAESSSSPSNPSPLFIPLTGGQPIGLSCDSAFWAFGIKLSFSGLCDEQTSVDSIGVNDLPGALPDGSTFVMGLEVRILSNNQQLDALPNGTSIEMGFPLAGGSAEQYVVLFWNGSNWDAVSAQGNDNPAMYQVLTTQDIGIFILVKK